eukprot:5715287-Amphidinium_carterae.4
MDSLDLTMKVNSSQRCPKTSDANKLVCLDTPCMLVFLWWHPLPKRTGSGVRLSYNPKAWPIHGTKASSKLLLALHRGRNSSITAQTDMRICSAGKNICAQRIVCSPGCKAGRLQQTLATEERQQRQRQIRFVV